MPANQGAVGERLDAGFVSVLPPFHLGELEDNPASVCGLWPDWTLAYLNPAWLQFSQDNGAPGLESRFGLGTSYLDALPPVLHGWYADLLSRALAGSERVDHDYECSSAEQYRLLRMSLFPLRHRAGVLVVHSVRVEHPHDASERPPLPPVDSRYRDARGLIVQCSHCRRTRRVDGTTWDWVPDWVRKVPPLTSHGLCPPCMRYYFGDLLEPPDEPEVSQPPPSTGPRATSAGKP